MHPAVAAHADIDTDSVTFARSGLLKFSILILFSKRSSGAGRRVEPMDPIFVLAVQFSHTRLLISMGSRRRYLFGSFLLSGCSFPTANQWLHTNLTVSECYVFYKYVGFGLFRGIYPKVPG